MSYDFKSLHIVTPVGLIQIEGTFSQAVYTQIATAFICDTECNNKKRVIYSFTIEQMSERWMMVKSSQCVQKVYYKSVCDFIENSITNVIVSETRKCDDFILFHGAACRFRNKVIIILGPKGCGKTTLLTNLLLSGAELISDDNILFDVRSGKIYSYICPVRIKGRADELKQMENFNETFMIIEENAGIVHLKCMRAAYGGDGIDYIVLPTKEKAILVNDFSEKELFDIFIHNIKNSECLKKKGVMKEVINLLKKPGKRVNTMCAKVFEGYL